MARKKQEQEEAQQVESAEAVAREPEIKSEEQMMEASPAGPGLCASCDELLDDAALERGGDVCSKCAGLLVPEKPSEEDPEDDFEPEKIERAQRALEPEEEEAFEALGLDRSHVLDSQVRGTNRDVVIVTNGGRRVEYRKVVDGKTGLTRIVLVGPEGTQWVQSHKGGYVARDERGKVMTNQAGHIFRIKHGKQILHDRDRGIKQEPAADLTALIRGARG